VLFTVIETVVVTILGFLFKLLIAATVSVFSAVSDFAALLPRSFLRPQAVTQHFW